MDPLSITAGVIAVVTAARGTVKGIKKASAYRKAPQEIESLVSELDALHTIVLKISDYLSANDSVSYNEDLVDTLASTQLKVEELEDALKSAGRDSKAFGYDRYRLSWMRKKSYLLALRDELRVVRLDLVLQLSLLGAYVGSKLMCVASSADAHAKVLSKSP